MNALTLAITAALALLAAGYTALRALEWAEERWA